MQFIWKYRNSKYLVYLLSYEIHSTNITEFPTTVWGIVHGPWEVQEWNLY